MSGGDFTTKSQVDELGRQFDQGNLSQDELLARIDRLIEVTERSQGRPNLTISNLDDIGLAGRIYSDIGRSSARRAGL
jgi:hypothetical protein